MSIEQENNDMLRSQIKEVAHHSKEIKEVEEEVKGQSTSSWFIMVKK